MVEREAYQWRYRLLSADVYKFKKLVGFDLESFNNVLFCRLKDSVSPRKTELGPANKLSSKSIVIMVLIFLRNGFTYEVLSGNFGLSESRCRNIIKDVISVFWDVLKDQIIWNGYVNQQNHLPEEYSNFSQVVGVVDCTEFQIVRPSSIALQKQFFRGKKKFHSVKLQIVVEPVSGIIIHIFGLFSGKIHDFNIFRCSDVTTKLREREFLMADSGYQGIQKYCNAIIPIKKSKFRKLTEDEQDFNVALSIRRVIVENTIEKIKKWKVLQGKYRGKVMNMELFTTIIYVCCALTNLKLKIMHH